MYTSYSHDVRTNKDASTKYTEYLKSVNDGSIFDSRSGGKKTKGGAVNKTPSRNQRRPGPGPLHAISDNEVKFSNIFSPNESNALKLQLLHKTSSLPVLHQDGDDNNDGDELVGDDVDPAVASRRRSSASALVHGTDPNTNHGARKGESESVANILYSTLRAGNDYENPSADETLHTGSDSKVDYDPHEPLPAVDQLALRHELLHNIRAISRATYFEDLYTGKVRHNLESPEAEVLQLLQNAPGDGSATLKHRKNNPPKDVTLRRVDRWVQEASEVSSHPQNNDTDEDKQNPNSSLFHQSVWEENKNKKRGRIKPVNKKSRNQEKTRTSDGSNTESEADTASVYHPRNLPTNSPPKIVTKYVPTNITNNSSDVRPVVLASKNAGSTSNPSANFDPQYLRAKYLTVHDTETDSSGMKRPFSFGRNSHDGSVPLSLSLPNVAHQNRYLSTSTPSGPHGLPTSYQSLSRSRPENLHHSVANNSVIIRKDKIEKRDSDKHNTVQVRKAVQPKPPPAAPMARHPQRAAGGNNRGHAARASKPERNQGPPIYQRLNKNQWVMKKVYFYVNGDEHIPRFEFRFRDKKDIRSWDQLLDILTKRFPSLPTGARHIFTTDGYKISGLDELVHENSYIVSSIKKLKALRDRSHDGDHFTNAEETKLKPSLYKSLHRPLTRKISASEGNLNSRSSPEPLQRLQRQSPQKSLSSLNTKSEEVPKLVAHVIEEASGSVSSSSSSPLARQPIRIINGSKPSLQTQVLLNTKTSQPFEDLVLDLAMSVRIPKQPIANQLHTLAGRQITSYSQLRSELKAGQRAFFVYSSLPEEDKSSTSSSQRNNVSHSRNGKSPLVKAILGKVNSNSSSDLSDIDENRSKRRNRRRSIPSPHSTTRFSNNSRYDSPIISRRSPFDVRRR